MAKTRDHVVIRFAGDSGDGMQLTGDRFTSDAAGLGNDISTLPNFPAEIRAPQGTLPGVSSFQVHFASFDIVTPGDAPDVLVAMNPAALKANVSELKPGGMIIADASEFTPRALKKVGYAEDPLTDDSLSGYQLHAINLTTQAVAAVKEFGLGRKDASRAKNMYALGLLSWLYSRDLDGTIKFLNDKFGSKPAIRDRPESGPRVWRNDRDVYRSLRGTGCSDASRRIPADLGQPSHRMAPTRSPRPPTFCTSSAATSRWASPRSRPKTRSRALALHSAHPSPVHWASQPRPAQAWR